MFELHLFDLLRTSRAFVVQQIVQHSKQWSLMLKGPLESGASTGESGRKLGQIG